MCLYLYRSIVDSLAAFLKTNYIKGDSDIEESGTSDQVWLILMSIIDYICILLSVRFNVHFFSSRRHRESVSSSHCGTVIVRVSFMLMISWQYLVAGLHLLMKKDRDKVNNNEKYINIY